MEESLKTIPNGGIRFFLKTRGNDDTRNTECSNVYYRALLLELGVGPMQLYSTLLYKQQNEYFCLKTHSAMPSNKIVLITSGNHNGNSMQHFLEVNAL